MDIIMVLGIPAGLECIMKHKKLLFFIPVLEL